MKKKRINLIVLLALFVLLFNPVHSQPECKVLVPALSGKYTGECKKGLAHGQGVAEGTDRYKGRFVKGYPHGTGRYDWSTGEYYEGDWKKGKRDGIGSYYFYAHGRDTVFAGKWEDDRYIGPDYPKPKISQQLNVARVDFSRVGDGDKVEFGFYQGGSPVQQIESLAIVGRTGSEYSVGNVVGYKNILFPYNCRITFSYLNEFKTQSFDAIIDLTISEPGSWKVKIYLL